MNKINVELCDLTYTRGEKIILENLSLSIPAGKLVAIMGPSGTGKTTLLKLITRELSPKQGKVLINQEDIQHLRNRDLLKLRRKMGVLFQNGALFTGLNVYENVAFPLREHYTLSETVIRSIVLMQLEMVGLRGAVNLMPIELSGGMARRVALARAMVTNPSLMLYDEPFAGQDPITMAVLMKLIKTINQELEITSVIVSHDVEETLSIADFVYIIYGGKIIGKGTPQEVKNDLSPLLTQFLRGVSDGPIPFHYPTKIDYYEDLGL